MVHFLDIDCSFTESAAKWLIDRLSSELSVCPPILNTIVITPTSKAANLLRHEFYSRISKGGCNGVAGIEFKTFENILDFHYRFERIHPFQDGNGRVGRLILFKECLRNNIVPFIIDEDVKMFYYRGLVEWSRDKAYLTDTCLSAQDKFKKYLDYFKIKY